MLRGLVGNLLGYLVGMLTEVVSEVREDNMSQRQGNAQTAVETREPIDYSIFNPEDSIQEFRDRIQWLFAKRRRAAKVFDARVGRRRGKWTAAIEVGRIARMRMLRKEALTSLKTEAVKRNVTTAEVKEGPGDGDKDAVSALIIDNEHEDKQDDDHEVHEEHATTAIILPEATPLNLPTHRKVHLHKESSAIIIPNKIIPPAEQTR
jgi:hypothetical protein